MGPSTLENMATIKAILHLFELVSRMKINYHKSHILGIKTSSSWVKDAATILNCKVGSLPFTYLGLSVCANPRRKRTWDSIVDKVKAILS